MLPSEPFISWLFELVPWMQRALGLAPTIGATVLPVEDDFPVDASLAGEELAIDWLSFVLEHAGMSGWDVGIRMENEIGPGVALKGMVHAMTSRPEGGVPVPVPLGETLPITCTHELLREPVHLVAHFARGLAHYRVHTSRDRPPGGDEMREAAIDVVSIFSGFGVFMANACHDARAFDDGRRVGFRVRHIGALGPIEMSYVLALRATLIRASENDISAHLRENPRAFFRDALRDVKKRPLDQLATTTPYR